VESAINTIVSFVGVNRFLSNFYASPIIYNDLLFPTVEHAYQAAKAKDSYGVQYDIAYFVPTSKEAKTRGRSVNMRTDWEDIKLVVMRELIVKKFEIPALRHALIDTGDATLIEGNTWNDTFWGVCNNIGENHLGKILMEVRMQIFKDLDIL